MSLMNSRNSLIGVKSSAGAGLATLITALVCLTFLESTSSVRWMGSSAVTVVAIAATMPGQAGSVRTVSSAVAPAASIGLPAV